MILVATVVVCAIIALFGIYFQIRYSARAVTQGPALLTMLGIAGTFLGIAIGLYHFSASDIAGSIPALLNGIRISVWASFTGILFAILLKVRYALAREDASESGDKSDVEVLSAQLQAIRAAIAGPDDLALISQLELVRADVIYRLDALQRAVNDLAARLPESSPEA
jgi:hypothetical protein